MTGKKTMCVSLILLIIASVILTRVILTRVSGKDDPLPVVPVVSLDPLNPVVPPGGTLLVNVTVANVTDMGTIHLMLGYNNTVLEAVRVYPTAITEDAAYWLPADPPVWDADPTINNTRTYAPDYSYVWIGAIYFTPYNSTDPTTQDPVFMINFTAIAIGNCTLDLFIMFDSDIFPGKVELLDSMGDPIAHLVIDGSVEVIPEFPAAIIIPLLLIATTAVALLGKTFWSRKRKDALIAE